MRFILLILFNSLLVMPLAQNTNTNTNTKATRFPESRMTMQGDVFMSWPFPVREWFVQSALAGYNVGYHQGCIDAKLVTLKKTALIEKACSDGQIHKDKSMFYAEQM